jgi:AcrR family transcriptional regulator
VEPGQSATTTKRDARRADLIRRAAELFDTDGYHLTSMGEIAEAVGVSKPTLYHYVASKDEILLEIHEQFIDPLIERQERRRQTALGAEQLILELIGDILEVIDAYRGHVRVFFEHHRELPPEPRAAIMAKRERYQELVEDVIRGGIDEGVFRPVDVELAALALFGMCNWAYQWYRPDGPMRSREIAYVFWDLLVHGLAAPLPTARSAP